MKKLFVVFLNLEKSYDRINKGALWNVLTILGVGGQLLAEIKAFCR